MEGVERERAEGERNMAMYDGPTMRNNDTYQCYKNFAMQGGGISIV